MCCYLALGQVRHELRTIPLEDNFHQAVRVFIPLLSGLFCCLGFLGVIFLLFGPGACFFFAVWAGGSCFFFCLGGGRVLFFAVWAGPVFFLLLFGPGACFFLLFGRRTGVHSLTRLPGSSLSDPTTKETEQPKKHGFLHQASTAESHDCRRPTSCLRTERNMAVSLRNMDPTYLSHVRDEAQG